jgi:hypothetical protein
MPNLKFNKFIPLIFAIVFTFLFYKQHIGLNLFIAQSMLAIYLLINRKIDFGANNITLLFVAYCTTSVFGIIIYTPLVYLVNWLFFACLIGALALEKAHSLPHAFISFFYSAFKAPFAYIIRLKNNEPTSKSGWLKNIKKIALFIVPVLVILIFMTLYRASNPKFDRVMSVVFEWLEPPFVWLSSNLNFALIFTFILCFIVATFALVYSRSKNISDSLNACVDTLIRKRRKWPLFKFNGLKNEYKSAVFLFGGLNVLLLIVNVIDIQWVWFDFEWNGQYLKQFVHEGTYLLIFSILISFSLVLYTFRENLNFYSKNTFLKKLSYAWLIQNMVLTLSVGIRNYHYIQHFALAYKRIAVLVFLVLTLVALAIVLIKVAQRKTMFFVMRYNALSLYTTLFVCALFPWDSIIIQYNFAHKETAFVHFNFLSRMENKNLPLLIQDETELQQIEMLNNVKVGPKTYYMTAEKYQKRIQDKKENFISQWEQKNWLSWNYAESRAYKQLKAE